MRYKSSNYTDLHIYRKKKGDKPHAYLPLNKIKFLNAVYYLINLAVCILVPDNFIRTI